VGFPPLSRTTPTERRQMPEPAAILKGPIIKVLVPTNPRRFSGHSSGHRALHYAGDAGGVSSHGVGLLLTQPFGRNPEMPAFSEAEYVNQGDWVIYAAPNELTNPHVIDVRTASEARKLARTYARRARAIFEKVDPRWVAALRRRMPYNKCAKCRKATDLFFVTNEEWARVGPRWLKEVLCRSCYDSLVGKKPRPRTSRRH
jgi:hypothetical protein